MIVFVRIIVYSSFVCEKKGEKQVSEECSGHSGQLRPKHNSPSILEGVPLGGVVILKYQNSLWKNAVNNDMRIKDYSVNNLLENR